jgi:hypothetical protein
METNTNTTTRRVARRYGNGTVETYVDELNASARVEWEVVEHFKDLLLADGYAKGERERLAGEVRRAFAKFRRASR